MAKNNLTTITHKCTQETRIALIQKSQDYTNEKLEAIHTTQIEMMHKLLGNGKVGLIEEQNIKIINIEKKLIVYATGITIIVFLLTLFGSRIVSAILGG